MASNFQPSSSERRSNKVSEPFQFSVPSNNSAETSPAENSDQEITFKKQKPGKEFTIFEPLDPHARSFNPRVSFRKAESPNFSDKEKTLPLSKGKHAKGKKSKNKNKSKSGAQDGSLDHGPCQATPTVSEKDQKLISDLNDGLYFQGRGHHDSSSDSSSSSSSSASSSSDSDSSSSDSDSYDFKRGKKRRSGKSKKES